MFNNIFNKSEYDLLCKKYNFNKDVKKINLIIKSEKYFDMFKKGVSKDRRGEVVFAVIRNEKIITIRSLEYPEGVFRIPTGGINYMEDPESAVHREVKEELGLKVNIRSFNGVIHYIFEHANETIDYYSYIFILDDIGGILLEDALEDEVSETRIVNIKELNGIAHNLLTLESFWDDWGRFRFETTHAIVEILKNATYSQE